MAAKRTILAIDTERVELEDGRDALAQVIIMDFYFTIIYKTYVKVPGKVKDYRFGKSGIREQDLINGKRFRDVQNDVREIIKNRFIVGQSPHHDLKALRLEKQHPPQLIRDTAEFSKFKKGLLVDLTRHLRCEHHARDVS